MQSIYDILVIISGTPANDAQGLILYIVSVALSVFLILLLFYILFILAKIAR